MEDGGSEYGTLGFPPSPKTSPRKELETTEEKEEEEQFPPRKRDRGGGFINHLLCNFIPEETPTSVEAEEEEVDIRKVASVLPQEDDNGGGILHTIVSHLPHPIADDTAPTSDEASMLLHAIVQD